MIQFFTHLKKREETYLEPPSTFNWFQCTYMPGGMAPAFAKFVRANMGELEWSDRYGVYICEKWQTDLDGAFRQYLTALKHSYWRHIPYTGTAPCRAECDRPIPQERQAIRLFRRRCRLLD